MSRAERAYQKQLADWQSERDRYSAFLDLAKEYGGEESTGIMLAAGESVFMKVNGGALIEDRRGPGHYAGRSQGLSIPVGKVGGRSVRYRIGVNKGHFEQGVLKPTLIDRGTVYVTDKRVIFQGAKQTRECVFAKMIGFEHDGDLGTTTFSVSNRQKPTTIMYGDELAAEFEFRLDLAFAHFRGDVDELVVQMQAELSHIDAERPIDPTRPAPAIAEVLPYVDAAPDDPAPVPMAADAITPAPIGVEESPSAPVVADVVPPAGWYVDPWGAAPLRWWDGNNWTGNVHAASELGLT